MSAMLATAAHEPDDPFAPAQSVAEGLETIAPQGAVAAWAPPGGSIDAAADDAQHQVFSGYSDGQLHSATNQPANGNTTKQPRGPKTATKAEVQAIQVLVDHARQAEAAAAALDAEAKQLAAKKDQKGARAKANEAAAKWRAAAAFKQEAIVKAVSAYGIDITHVTSLLYKRGISDSGLTNDDRGVTIGDTAFTSPGNLASTLAHESEVHVNQQVMRGRLYPGAQGNALNELQAYDWEIANAKRFGLTKAEVDSLRKVRQRYVDMLNATYQARRAKGDYSLPQGHEDD